MGDDGGLRTGRLRLRPWTIAPEDIAWRTDLYGRVDIRRGLGGTPSVVGWHLHPDSWSIAVCRRLGMAPFGRLRRWYDVEPEAFRLMAPVVVE